jgi:NADH dehydrogenase (ubiquinone) 1 alpha subcomplex subunit 5
LAVDYEAVPKMLQKYQLLLDTMVASDMPETYHYRVLVEKMCRYRIQACLDYPDDPEMVEELCNCGQVEELVEQADDEMEVLQMILKKRWWERIRAEDVVVEENPDPTKDAENVTWEEEPIELKRKE